MDLDQLSSPDLGAAGLVTEPVKADRYDRSWEETAVDPYETDGLLRRLMPAEARVLDIGGGTGASALAVNAGKNNRIVLVEPDAERAAMARSRGLETYCEFLDRTLADQLGTFDVILFSDVLEHLPDPSALLSLAHDMLNEGGLVLASVPNVAHWTVRLNLLRGRFDYQPFGIMDATHLRWFTTRTLRDLFEASSFDVMTFEHTAGSWMHPYHAGPFKYVPNGVRRRAVYGLRRAFPSLFGCQHIVAARKRPLRAK